MATPGYIAPQLGAAAIERIKSENSIVDVLRRMGIEPPPGWDGHSDYRLSPSPVVVSGENGASFIVHPQTGLWHDFRLDASGDVIALVQRVTGLKSVSGAAKRLDRGGPIAALGGLSQASPELSGGGRAEGEATAAVARTPAEKPDLGRTPLDRVRAVNAQAWRYYTLPKLAEQAREYLAGRHIYLTALEKETGRPLAGHTPTSWAGLTDHLRTKGFTDDELVDAGWVSRRDGRVCDKFHGRVLMPFRDIHDRVVGVTGRAVDWHKGDGPKYFNHPATLTFDKSAVLYRPAVTNLDQNATVIACEGTLDALAIVCAAARVGASNRFAPCSQSGLSLTDQVAPQFFGLSKRVPILCADSDGRGRAATLAWVTNAMTRHHREVLTVDLPDGMDPAEWLAAEGDLGLIAFSRPGCLNAGKELRPTPAGGMLARHEVQTALEAARAVDPDIESAMLAPTIIQRLAQRAAAVPGQDAQHRFAAAAGTELARLIDGADASKRASQLRCAINQLTTVETAVTSPVTDRPLRPSQPA